MKQPFEQKYIKRYIILYVGVIISMVIFYFLNSSNNPKEQIDKKEFSTTAKEETLNKTYEKQNSHDIKLLEKRY
ncbi:MAG: hypothetical protein U9P71_02835 [Campylobacterota bacterium]|nr:hypothetical protein [Campylobacterota bacterium]